MQILRVDHQGSARYARASSPETAELLTAAPWAGGTSTGERIPRTSLRLLAPVAPSKIVCVGRNYAAHAQELGNQVPDEPLIFLKPPSALLDPGAAIVIPAASQRVEHEAEIGLVIGRRLAHASIADALRGIFGVTCVNDVTARDLQRKEVQFTRAKGFDTFCPVGPWIETESDLAALTVVARVNGEQRQAGTVSQMIFGLGELVSFISGVMTLEPGDLISTGTPHGVGPLHAGDLVEIEIASVGVLQNPVVAAAP
jgi:2-keto-4-pentenoate hydratase/2-oxohepta-3-ene-1,7-dioic acid hydratase in catechol pathway